MKILKEEVLNRMIARAITQPQTQIMSYVKIELLMGKEKIDLLVCYN